MKVIFVILLILISPFLLAFILGFIKASASGSENKRRARAMFSLSQMTKEQIKALRLIYQDYKDKRPDRANEVCSKLSIETANFLISFFAYENRPPKYSSGNMGKFTFLDFEKKLINLGYSESVSKIIPGVIMDNYNEVLDKMIDNYKEDRNSEVVVLGETIDPDNMPKLYHWAKTNPDTLKRQLKSIVKAWHNGDVRATMIALESDLEHG